MSPMIKGIFRPGRGAVIQSFTTAVSDGVIYPADWVALSTTAPTSQGPNGDGTGLEFGTLTAEDYVECTLLDTDNAGGEGLALGVCMGENIGSVSDWTNVLGQVLADGDVCVIQCWGVHPNGRQVTGGVLGDQLAPSGVAGEVTNSVTVAAADTGVALIATSNYLRATADDEQGSDVFITCAG